MVRDCLDNTSTIKEENIALKVPIEKSVNAFLENQSKIKTFNQDESDQARQHETKQCNEKTRKRLETIMNQDNLRSDLNEETELLLIEKSVNHFDKSQHNFSIILDMDKTKKSVKHPSDPNRLGSDYLTNDTKIGEDKHRNIVQGIIKRESKLQIIDESSISCEKTIKNSDIILETDKKEKSIAILSNPDSLRSDNITENMKTGEEEQDKNMKKETNFRVIENPPITQAPAQDELKLVLLQEDVKELPEVVSEAFENKIIFYDSKIKKKIKIDKKPAVGSLKESNDTDIGLNIEEGKHTNGKSFNISSKDKRDSENDSPLVEENSKEKVLLANVLSVIENPLIFPPEIDEDDSDAALQQCKDRHEVKAIMRMETIKKILSNTSGPVNVFEFFCYIVGTLVTNLVLTTPFSILPAHNVFQDASYWYETPLTATSHYFWMGIYYSCSCGYYMNILFIQNLRNTLIMCFVGCVETWIFYTAAYYIWTYGLG